MNILEFKEQQKREIESNVLKNLKCIYHFFGLKIICLFPDALPVLWGAYPLII